MRSERERVGVIDALALSATRLQRSQSRQMPAVERSLKCGDCGGRDVKCGPVERR